MTTPEPRRWRRVDFHEEHGHTAIVAKPASRRRPAKADARLHFTLLLFLIQSGRFLRGGHSRTSKENLKTPLVTVLGLVGGAPGGHTPRVAPIRTKLLASGVRH